MHTQQARRFIDCSCPGRFADMIYYRSVADDFPKASRLSEGHSLAFVTRSLCETETRRFVFLFDTLYRYTRARRMYLDPL
jgi:hypothetical protein